MYTVQFPNDEATSWLSKLPKHRCHTAKRRLKPNLGSKADILGANTEIQQRPLPLPEFLFVYVMGT